MGCGSAQNGKMKESSTMKESEETISIKTYDWNHARIKDMVDMQCFGNGPIVQNENYSINQAFRTDKGQNTADGFAASFRAGNPPCAGAVFP